MNQMIENPTDYFHQWVAERSDLLHKLESEAEMQDIPIVGPVVGRLLYLLTRLSKARLILDMKNLHWDKINHLEPLREKLAAYRSRIELVLPKLLDHPELMLLARMFQHNLA